MDPVISFLQSLLETQEEDGSFASIGTNLALSLAIQEDARNQKPSVPWNVEKCLL